MNNSDKYATENVRRVPLWKKVPCPTCGQPTGKNCWDAGVKCKTLFGIRHEERQRLAEPLKAEGKL